MDKSSKVVKVAVGHIKQLFANLFVAELQRTLHLRG